MAHADRIGQVISGRYVLRSILGQGGMGAVYEALDRRTERVVAVKLLHRHLEDDRIAVERFLREIRASTLVEHRHVIEVLSSGVDDDGAPYFAMERLEGETLEPQLARREPMSARRAVGIVAQLLDALAAMHRAGIVHRDLKPANVFLVDRGSPVSRAAVFPTTAGDFVKVLDFGVAAWCEAIEQVTRSADLTPAGRVMGTPYYAAPEQIAGISSSPDPRTDVYAAGVLLYELLTGERPFQAPDLARLSVQIVEEPAPPMRVFVQGVEPGLEQVVRWALEKRPDQRPPDAESLRGALLALGA